MRQTSSSAENRRPTDNQQTFDRLSDRLFATRQHSLALAAPLTPEDMVVQAMEDASPTKWHLAHVTWFFENFVLKRHLDGYRIFDDAFNYCFNSYYETLGPRHPRPKRGLLTQPSADRVLAYRAHVDEALHALLSTDAGQSSEVARLLEIGINHEQQHQELLLTDILALFAANPLKPAYQPYPSKLDLSAPQPVRWLDYAGGIQRIGHTSDGYHWDNEGPSHETLIHPFKLADRLVTNAEWLEFIEDKGYGTASLWLADGWSTVNREEWQAPLYWQKTEAGWFQMSLHGLLPVVPAEPVAHVSYYEADAFARWAGKRLPTEFEWETAALTSGVDRESVHATTLRPQPAAPGKADSPKQLFGDVWQWSASAYLPYPGYKPPAGAIGEYNGKFMVSQQVLRGASCATPQGHSRPTYRNFFYPHQRWQFAGLRLASEID
ncbi:ergothioneine biosynthesis protein EgtB [Hyphomicrobium sp.]|jgi:ergothioneine biosynthesis protein EgtB|uniref:ergothioneine biosynthesis protein EgtB n=1 Tax=Hyphomicrobium sp. TaxID=82 RepID=UPI002BCD883F|nr:ergothioneine biosynthesis protein EgtB [Hyphomicrobium sp.]HVZ03161.1 ergothioneine biosynthesis protein EgtB [Hyphomicrobium sp.]